MVRMHSIGARIEILREGPEEDWFECIEYPSEATSLDSTCYVQSEESTLFRIVIRDWRTRDPGWPDLACDVYIDGQRVDGIPIKNTRQRGENLISAGIYDSDRSIMPYMFAKARAQTSELADRRKRKTASNEMGSIVLKFYRGIMEDEYLQLGNYASSDQSISPDVIPKKIQHYVQYGQSERAPRRHVVDWMYFDKDAPWFTLRFKYRSGVVLRRSGIRILPQGPRDGEETDSSRDASDFDSTSDASSSCTENLSTATSQDNQSANSSESDSSDAFDCDSQSCDDEDDSRSCVSSQYNSSRASSSTTSSQSSNSSSVNDLPSPVPSMSSSRRVEPPASTLARSRGSASSNTDTDIDSDSTDM